MLIGLDVGGTNARGILFDPKSGAVIDQVVRPSDGSGSELRSKLVEMVSELRDASSFDVDSIGLGIAGLALRSGVVRYSPNLPGLVEYPIGSELASATGLPVTTVNDATAGAWAEAKLGAGRGVDDLAFVALGTGIGTGFIVNGEIVLGANGFAGESGHMVVEATGPEHVTGQRGPWEYYASGNALGRLGREAAGRGDFEFGLRHVRTLDEVTGFHVVEGLMQGDADAAAIFDNFCCDVARGLANLILILDSQRVVLGGGLTDIGEPLRRGVDDWLHRLLPGAERRPAIEVALAELGTEAGSVGAALLGRDLMFDD